MLALPAVVGLSADVVLAAHLLVSQLVIAATEQSPRQKTGKCFQYSGIDPFAEEPSCFSAPNFSIFILSSRSARSF